MTKNRYFPTIPAGRRGRLVRRPREEINRGLAWYAVWTRPHAERLARDELNRAGIETYLPMQTLEVVRQGKLVEVERVPVNRYLFVGLDAAAPAFPVVDEALGGVWRWSGGFVLEEDGSRTAVPSRLTMVPPSGSLLRVAGEPIRVGAGALQAYADECTEIGLRGVASGRSALRRYQTARITSGPLSGLRMQVSDVLGDERVKGLVDMLGGRVVVEATMDQLEAA